jgi:peptidoglycan/xylan/chitin deacetylase (PgdA/CDA1 family)
MATDVIAEALAAGPDATLAVMYHYVRPPDPGLSGIVPLAPEAFRHQLELLTRHFDVVDPDTLPEWRRTARPKAVITFDDGTRDQYDFAFPILREMGLPAVIACISGPRLLGLVPTVHLVHLLVESDGHATPHGWPRELSAEAGGCACRSPAGCATAGPPGNRPAAG